MTSPTPSNPVAPYPGAVGDAYGRTGAPAYPSGTAGGGGTCTAAPASNVVGIGNGRPQLGQVVV